MRELDDKDSTPDVVQSPQPPAHRKGLPMATRWDPEKLAREVALTMLPIAYITFFVKNNKRSYIGEAVGHGWKRFAFNLVLLVAIIMATIGAMIGFRSRVLGPIKAWLDKPTAAARS